MRIDPRTFQTDCGLLLKAIREAVLGYYSDEPALFWARQVMQEARALGLYPSTDVLEAEARQAA